MARLRHDATDDAHRRAARVPCRRPPVRRREDRSARRRDRPLGRVLVGHVRSVEEHGADRAQLPRGVRRQRRVAGRPGDRRRGAGASMREHEPAVPDLQAGHAAGDQLRVARAEGEVHPAHLQRREPVQLRAQRTRCRQRRRVDDHQGRRRRRQLDHQRHQVLDHQRRHQRSVHRLRAHLARPAQGHHRLPGRGRVGCAGRQARAQAGHQGLAHRCHPPRRSSCARRQPHRRGGRGLCCRDAHARPQSPHHRCAGRGCGAGRTRLRARAAVRWPRTRACSGWPPIAR